MVNTLGAERVIAKALAVTRLGQGRVTTKGNLYIGCPSCGRDDKFAVQIRTGAYHCFSCHFNGSVLSALSDPDVLRQWQSVKRSLGGRWGKSDGGLSDRPGAGSLAVSLSLWTIGAVSLPMGPPEAARPFPGQTRRGRAYCLSRGMTSAQIARYRVCVSPGQDRVFFPFWAADGKTVFWMGRATNAETKPKTLEPGTAKPLFGVHASPYPLTGMAVSLVEGVFDHFATPGSLALMGSSINRWQLTQLKEAKPKWVPVLLDPDAIRYSLQIAALIWKSGIKACPVRVSADRGKDPGDFGFVKMRGLVRRLEQMPVPTRPGQIYEVRI